MPNPNHQTYLLKGIPKDVYDRAKAKAAAHNPPLSIRWILITLLEKWVNHGAAPMGDPVTTDETPIGAQPGKVAKPAKAPRAVKSPKAKAQKVQTAPASYQPPTTDLPDLSTTF